MGITISKIINNSTEEPSPTEALKALLYKSGNFVSKEQVIALAAAGADVNARFGYNSLLGGVSTSCLWQQIKHDSGCTH